MTTFERTHVEFVPGWVVIGAMQGRTAPFDEFISTPTLSPEPCRDNFKVSVVERKEGPILAFALADGISSQSNSGHGSRIAVEAAIEGLNEECQKGLPERRDFERIIAHAHRRLENAAKSAQQNLNSFGTTLILAALDPTEGSLACASVGDGNVVADEGGALVWFPEELGFEPTGAVYSITDRNWMKVINYHRFPNPIQTMIAFTDGLQHIMFEVNRKNPNNVVRSPHRKAVDTIRSAILQTGNVSRTRNIATLLGMRDDVKLMADDRTVVIAQSLRPKRSTPISIPVSAPTTPNSDNGEPEANEIIAANSYPIEKTSAYAQTSSPVSLPPESSQGPDTHATNGLIVWRRNTARKLTAMLVIVAAILAIQLAEALVPRFGEFQLWLDNTSSLKEKPIDQQPTPVTQQPAPAPQQVAPVTQQPAPTEPFIEP